MKEQNGNTNVPHPCTLRSFLCAKIKYPHSNEIYIDFYFFTYNTSWFCTIRYAGERSKAKQRNYYRNFNV